MGEKRLGVEGRERKREKDGPSKRNPVLEELKGDTTKTLNFVLNCPNNLIRRACMGTAFFKLIVFFLRRQMPFPNSK